MTGQDERLKPLETLYDGHRFRSRREARWAVFFKEAGIPAQYEEQGYDLGAAGWYLPDFRINSGTPADHFFEVKGVAPTREELAKAEALCEQSKLPVYVYYAEPRLPASSSLTYMTGEIWLNFVEQTYMEGLWLPASSGSSWRLPLSGLHPEWPDKFEPAAYRALTCKGKPFSRALPLWWTDCPHCGLVVPKLHGQVGCCPALSDDGELLDPLYPQFKAPARCLCRSQVRALRPVRRG